MVKKTLTIRVRRPVHITLAHVPSESNPEGKPYVIALDRHNMVFCTCKAWRYQGHSCKHLTAFRQALAAASEKLVA
jgi:hypothetical protein